MSFIKFGYYAFFHGEYDGDVKDANRGQSVAMVLVAALCVFYGIFDGALFAILPFDVTDGAVVDKVYKTYTVTHIVEGLALAVLGLVGFRLVKKPLSGLGKVPDVDKFYNPATFYGTRYLVVGVTELYARVDDAAVALAKQSVAAAKNPEATLASVTGRESVETKAGIDRSLLLVLAVLVAALAVLLI
jgi:multicomponent Na+:H+ antiporter subunit D